MRSRTTRCGQVRGVQPRRIGRCHDLPMFHVKQPPRRVSEGRRVVRPVGVPTNRGAAVFSREDSGGPSTGARGRPAVHGNGIETPWATEPRAAALWPIVEETRPAPLTGNPVVGESAWRRGSSASAAKNGRDAAPHIDRWQGARAATSRSACSAQRFRGPFGRASDASVSEPRAPRTYAASTMDGRRQRMRSSASTVCSLAVVEPISSHVVPDIFHVKHVETTACSVMGVSTPARRGTR